MLFRIVATVRSHSPRSSFRRQSGILNLVRRVPRILEEQRAFDRVHVLIDQILKEYRGKMSGFDIRAPVRERKKAADSETSWHFILCCALGFAALGFWALRTLENQRMDNTAHEIAAEDVAHGEDTDIAQGSAAKFESVAGPSEPIETWEHFAPKSKEVCLKEGSGKFDAAFLACRRGGKRLIREQAGERIVVEEQINDYSKVTPEAVAASRERTRRWNARADAPIRHDSKAQPENSAIAAAEANCNLHRYGTVEYRDCRGRMWRWLRDTCISLRGELPLVKAELRDTHRARTDLFCSAERKYKIID